MSDFISRNMTDNPFPRAQANGTKRLSSAQTSGSYSSQMLYQPVLPSNMDVFEKINKPLHKLSNPVVKNQTNKVLQGINNCLRNYIQDGRSANYLSKLNIVEQNDTSALIEWNFHNFRVGFSIEPNIEQSYYFVVSEDESIGSFSTDSRRIGHNYDAAVREIVKFVMENT